MVNSVLTAIGEEIKKHYPKAVIYVDDVNNGFTPGSFFLYAADVAYVKGLTNYYRGNARLVIKYFPSEGQSNLEVNEIMQKLIRELCLLKIGSKGLISLGSKSIAPDTDFSQLSCKVAWRDLKVVTSDKFNRINSLEAITKQKG